MKRWCHGVGGVGLRSPKFVDGLDVIASNRKKTRRMRTRVISQERRMRVIILAVEMESIGTKRYSLYDEASSNDI